MGMRHHTGRWSVQASDTPCLTDMGCHVGERGGQPGLKRVERTETAPNPVPGLGAPGGARPARGALGGGGGPPWLVSGSPSDTINNNLLLLFEKDVYVEYTEDHALRSEWPFIIIIIQKIMPPLRKNKNSGAPLRRLAC